MNADESDAGARTRQTSWIVGLATVGTSTTVVITVIASPRSARFTRSDN